MGPSVTTPPCSKVRKLSLREAKSLTQAHTAGTRTHKSQHLSVRLAKCPPLTLQKVKVKLFSCVRLFATSWTVAYQPPSSMGFSRQEYWAYQASLSMGFSRQEYWNGLPFPSLEDLPRLGIEPGSPALQADALPSEPPGKLQKFWLTFPTDSGSPSASYLLQHLGEIITEAGFWLSPCFLPSSI